MKFLVILIASLALMGSAYAGGEVKEKCRNKKDNAGNVVKDKDGKPVQICRKVKVHKKLEGTKVPDQAKK